MIEPSWILLFSKKRGPWWVRLLACGLYHHVKAIAFLPAMRAWLIYDVRFNGTRLTLADDDEPTTHTFLRDYLDSCDLIAMPRLPIPKRVAPHAGFWCTLAMKHLVGIRTGALRPDRLWRDSIAAGGNPYESALGDIPIVAGAAFTQPKDAASFELMLAFVRAHAQMSSATVKLQTWPNDAALDRRRSELVERLRDRIRALRAGALRAGARRRSRTA